MIAGALKGPIHFRQEQSSAGRAYLIQYISLILMILTFVVGIFGASSIQKKQQEMESAPPPPQQIVSLPRPAPIAISDLSYADVFVHGSSKVNSQELEALTQLLQAHDLKARIELYAAAETSSALSDLSLALTRSKQTYQQFRNAGVPAEALHLEVVGASLAQQLRVRLYRSAP